MTGLTLVPGKSSSRGPSSRRSRRAGAPAGGPPSAGGAPSADARRRRGVRLPEIERGERPLRELKARLLKARRGMVARLHRAQELRRTSAESLARDIALLNEDITRIDLALFDVART